MNDPSLYGALYVDRGEQMPKAVDQIRDLRQKVAEQNWKPIAFVFDVLFKTKRDATGDPGRQQTAEIETAIHEAFDGLDVGGMLVIVVASRAEPGDDHRPGRDLVVAMNTDPPRATELLQEYMEAAEAQRGRERSEPAKK